ncbi:MAG: hypothetical protein WBW93_02530 [Steroidobacteraceae bacterium]
MAWTSLHRPASSPQSCRGARGSTPWRVPPAAWLIGAGLIGAGLIGAGLIAPAAGAAAPPAAMVLVCTNPVSHASWQIHIDFDKRTVDSNPARISNTKISWHDRSDGGNYTLDRQSGELTVVLASSTGGYFLHDRCALEPSRPGP